MSAHTPGPWAWADVPGAGLQIRGPYKDSTRLLFTEIWRALPELEWDATMVKNTQLAAAAPQLLAALKYARRMVNASKCDIAFIDAAIAKATGGAA